MPNPEFSSISRGYRLASQRARWIDRFKALSAWRLVAVSRFALAVFALIAIYIDPTQPVRNSEIAYQILVAYALYSGLLTTSVGRFVSRFPFPYLVHAIDIVTFSTVIYLTDGPTSPFFVFLTFALFSATLRWAWRGAVVTTIATVAIYGALAAIPGDFQGEGNRIVMRSAHLVVAGVLFAYFGIIIERLRLRVAGLMAMPAGVSLDSEYPPIEPLLRRACDITKATRLVVVWEDEDGPGLHTAELETGVVSFDEIPGVLDGALEQPGGVAVFYEARHLPRAVPEWITHQRQMANVIIAPVTGASLKGYMLFINCEEAGEDLLPVASVAAARVGSEIAQDNFRRQLVAAAKTEERQKLAQDIHDDLLQGLTAVSMELAALSKQRGQMAGQLTRLRDVIGDQQNKLRTLLRESKREPFAWKTFAAASRLSKLVDKFRTQWSCAASFVVEPPELVLGETVGKGIEMLISEAIANGVRHGGAKRFEIRLQSSRAIFTLTIRDDGPGLDAPFANFDHETVMAEQMGSSALRQRVSGHGWRLALNNSAKGLEIVVRGGLE